MSRLTAHLFDPEHHEVKYLRRDPDAETLTPTVGIEIAGVRIMGEENRLIDLLNVILYDLRQHRALWQRAAEGAHIEANG
jgi:hypothetical protein